MKYIFYGTIAVVKILPVYGQVFPPAFGVVKEADETKCAEHLHTLESKLTELEQHLATSNEPFFGGMNFQLIVTIILMIIRVI